MISLGMIVRNAEATLEKCLESVAPYVDEIVIGLGGESTDQTEAIARKFTDKVFPITWTNDFSEARNQVLQKVSGDYFLWLDADDELVGGENIRELPEKYPQVDAFYWGYEYSRDEEGNTTCYLVRERLVRLSPGWKWVGAVHEVLTGPPDHLKFLVGNVLVRHHKLPHEDELRNLKILYSQLEEGEPNPDPRILVYLGTENASRGNFSEAILHLRRYVSMSGWDEEKYQAQHRIADIYRAMGDLQKARQADFEAISIRPDWPDAYLGLAETSFHEQKFHETIEWTKAAGTKKAPQTMMIVNPRDYDYSPLVILGLAYAHLGDYEMAHENMIRAYEMVPDKNLEQSLRTVQTELEGHKLVDAFTAVWQHLAQNDEWLKARRIFDSVPKLIEKVPPIQNIRGFTLRSTAHVDNPELMIEDYRTNPDWQPIKEELLDDPEWIRFPRVAYALELTRRLKAQRVIDFGSSDGFIAIPVARETGIKVHGIDLDPRCIDLANKRAKDRKLEYVSFATGDATSFVAKEKYDLGIAFEIIEHVVDPGEFLDNLEKSAKHIALTTPHLAWQSPAPRWDDEGFKGHLRIFDLLDIEALLSTRGRIYNLYRQPHGSSGWIFADYAVGEETRGHVVILAPGTPEAWSPLTFEREGLGGSETAVIGLGEALARSDYQVSVFSRIADEGYFNRVRYRDQQRYVPDIRSDLFIAWRAPELIDDAPNTAHAILWMHDTDAGDRLTPSRAAKFESIVVLSNWHRQFMLQRYPFLDPEKLVVIPNGVDIEAFNEKVTRDPKRVVYSSSPDRGLDYILEHVWPKVLDKEPEAELHIYYGWNNFDKYMSMFPQMIEFKNKVMDLLSKSRNVIQHGRIPQKKLAKEMLAAGVWLYPTNFPETFCITSVEVQLAGCYPVTNDLAALAENVQAGTIFKLSEWPLEKEETTQVYADATVAAMHIEESIRQGIRERVPALSWDGVAKRWIKNWLASGSSIQPSDQQSIPSKQPSATPVP